MDKSELIEKLKKMRLPVIAEQYELQSANPEYNQLSFDERFVNVNIKFTNSTNIKVTSLTNVYTPSSDESLSSLVRSFVR